jgi:hypothetical protein
MFPLSMPDISLWISIMAIILLITSELITQHSDRLGYFAIDRKRLQLAAIIMGLAFVSTVVLRVVAP